MEKKLYILEEDWKNLIILDACRYDYFKCLCLIPGKLEKRITLADATIDFVNANFKDRAYQDITYFNATPAANYKNYIDGFEIWDIEGATDNPFKVVLPDFFRRQIESRLSPSLLNKRFILHFLQPHYPFIYEPEDSPLRIKADSEYDASNCLKYGRKHGWDRIRKAYGDNLKGALREIAKLMPKLFEGKTVITSDHGELLGRDNKYGHGGWKVGISPEYNEIWEVPWFTVDRERSEKVSSQLRALGYL